MAKLFLKKIPSVPKLKPLGDAVRKAQWESMLGVGEGRERKMCVAFGIQEGTPVKFNTFMIFFTTLGDEDKTG